MSENELRVSGIGISKSVVSTIVSLAASKVDGVASVGGNDIAAAAEMGAQGIAVNRVAEIGHIEIGLHGVLSKWAHAFQR